MTRVASDHEILRQREPHWREQGWTAREVADAREHALLGTEPPCLREPRDIWELVREMREHLDTRGAARDESAEFDVAEDLELAL